ncbi:MAG: hypothetical protein RL152_475 [Bacteroidota bacterium]
MRLICLKANQPSFKTVHFNPSGISIIVGKKEGDSAKNRKGTYNGVGKSLVIALVHFCLGGNEKKGLTKPLKSWVFTLEFEINDQIYTSTRSTHEPTKIFLNGRAYKLESFREYLEGLLFELPEEPVVFLKFRPLISRFIRPSIEGYKSFDNAVPKEQDYARQLCNSFLLGLDPILAQRKFKLRTDLTEIKTLAKNISKDEVLKQFFHEGERVEFEVVSLTRKIISLEKKIANFIIADDLDALKREADTLSEELRSLRNRRVLIENALRSIEKSLTIQPDITSNELLRFYEEAKVQLTDLIVKEVREIEDFNQKLIGDRQKRLEVERRKLLSDLEDVKSKILTLGKIEDEKLKMLESTGALDDYRVLTDELSASRVRLERLESYQKLMEEYKIKQLQIENQLNEENIETINYLKRQKSIIDEDIFTFQELALQFYENKKSGIKIENNEGENLLRYKIEAEIEHDRSDGINQVKLFCFDFTILKNHFNHKVNFIFHDSRLLDPMDPRQRASVLNIAYEECRNHGFQYIISANEDALESLRDEFDDKSFQEVVMDNIILELTDASDATKLLGTSIDMNYEKD